jgi:hypothetical protein
MATYSKTSPYYTTDIVNNYLDVINFRDLPRQADDILFEITKKYENRPDLLAYDLYANQNLWWVFSVRNVSILKDPIFDFTPGTRIYLPKLSTINRTLEV